MAANNFPTFRDLLIDMLKKFKVIESIEQPSDRYILNMETSIWMLAGRIIDDGRAHTSTTIWLSKEAWKVAFEHAKAMTEWRVRNAAGPYLATELSESSREFSVYDHSLIDFHFREMLGDAIGNIPRLYFAIGDKAEGYLTIQHPTDMTLLFGRATEAERQKPINAALIDVLQTSALTIKHRPCIHVTYIASRRKYPQIPEGVNLLLSPDDPRPEYTIEVMLKEREQLQKRNDEPTTVEDWKAIAEFLFAQLDNIDTASDVAKGDMGRYAQLVGKFHKRRFAVGSTDGQTVTFHKPGSYFNPLAGAFDDAAFKDYLDTLNSLSKPA